jgi:hypothetical protein
VISILIETGQDLLFLPGFLLLEKYDTVNNVTKDALQLV